MIGTNPELNQVNEQTKALTIEKHVVGFFDQQGIKYVKTSADPETGDLDYCLRSDQRLTEQNIQKITERFSSDAQINAYKVHGKQIGKEVNLSNVRTKFDPFGPYISSGISVLTINGLQVDFISGYTLVALVKEWEKKTGQRHLYEVAEIGSKELKTRVASTVPRVDFSLAIGRGQFIEEINGVSHLSPPLRMLKTFLEFDYLNNLKPEEKKTMRIDIDARIKENLSSLKKNLENYKQAKNAGNEKILESVEEFLKLQVQVSNLDQDTTRALILKFSDTINEIDKLINC